MNWKQVIILLTGLIITSYIIANPPLLERGFYSPVINWPVFIGLLVFFTGYSLIGLIYFKDKK